MVSIGHGAERDAMRILHPTQLATLRVWVGEKRTTGFDARAVLSGSVPPSTRANAVERAISAGVEALVPRGARAEYGLLAVTFVPVTGDSVQIDVPYCTEDGPRWAESLAERLDDVRLGLPPEYAIAALASLSAAAGEHLPSGTLRVAEAAHGRVGSSQRMFARLARATVVLATMADLHDESLEARMRAILAG